jgi:pimeloyl-ACP methyl ester carboxylesterase
LKSGRKIALHIMLLPAMSAKSEPDPFFGLAGGPGQSATEAFPTTGYVAKVRELRDVVLVDQRGTGQSNPLLCSLQSLDNAQSILGDPYSQEKIRECRKESDKKADTTQYTTSVAADDLDEVRQAMGYDKINVFGGSYGTKAALVYLRLHGDHVRTLTLEAVTSPQFLIPLPFAKGVQSSVDGVIALCAADAACQKDYPDFRNEFKTLVERLEKSPAQFQINNQSVTLSREMFVSKLRGLLYIPQFVSAFPFIIHSAYQGNWSPYGGATLTLAGALEGAVARGATFAAICAEDVPALTEAAIRRETAGTYLGDSQVRRFKSYCEAWGQAGSIPKDFYSPVRSPAPTLLISGALDPATPPETAKQAAQYLVNSRLITVKEGTHGTGSPCLDGLIAEFVKRGSVTGLDASCADQIHLPPFLTKGEKQ